MLFYNEDWIHFVLTRNGAQKEITEALLREYVYSFKGTQVTDFVMNVNGTVSTADSNVFETFADKYLAASENGIPVDYKNTFAAEVYKLICEKKIDMYKVWIDAAKEIGINPWISIRMNDCHGNMEKTELRKSSYVDQHPEYHIAAHRDRIGYFDKCLDYGHKEVRQKMLDYIDEMLGRYDVYGLELDMMRDTFFFQFGCEYGGAPIMRAFMQDVIAIIEKNEKKYGHRIKRSLILPPAPNLIIERGVNIFDFADALDCIVIIPRWETFDSDMPIELWKQLLRSTNVLLGCGQQLLYKPYRGFKPVMSSVQMAFGQAAANLSRGGDFVYLYNYMDMAEHEGYIGAVQYEECVRNDANRPILFNNIGNLETLMRQRRSHMVTYSDFCRYDSSVCPVLPVIYTDGCTSFSQIKIPVGKLPENARVRLILGIASDDEVQPCDITVYVNATACEFEKITKINERIYENNCYVYTVGGEKYGIMYAEINIRKACRLEYVEIEAIPE